MPDGGPATRGPLAAALTVLIGVLVFLPVAACGDGPAGGEETNAPSDLVLFVYDRSGSMSDYQFELARKLTDGRLRTLDHGDRIVAMELLEASLEEPPRRWSQQVPEREYPDREVSSDSVTRVRFLRDARTYMENFTDTASREPSRGTDILSTFHDVASDLRAYPDHRATLYLFSDMLQANAAVNFEQPGDEPPTGWVEQAEAEGRLPDLSGLCVVVVGARTDTEKGQDVKEFWHRYFESTGATLRDRNYILRPVELPEAPCRGHRDAGESGAR